jgi:hypothetical protein
VAEDRNTEQFCRLTKDGLRPAAEDRNIANPMVCCPGWNTWRPPGTAAGDRNPCGYQGWTISLDKWRPPAVAEDRNYCLPNVAADPPSSGGYRPWWPRIATARS